MAIWLSRNLVVNFSKKATSGESKVDHRSIDSQILRVRHLAPLRFAKRPVATLNLNNPVEVQGTPLPRQPKIKEITNSTRKIKNRIFAIPADAMAMPPNPKTAATSAMIRKTTAQPNMFHLLED
jgi:hypothetical protein